MMYSQEDLDTLVENYRQIEKYIKENYVPLLEENETVSAHSGDSHLCFYFDKKSIYASQNPCFLQFGVGMPGHIDVYQRPEIGEDLCLYWGDIKKGIQSYFDKREKKREAIRNFRV